MNPYAPPTTDADSPEMPRRHSCPVCDEPASMIRHWSGLRACETCGTKLGVQWPLRSRIALVVTHFVCVPFVLWASTGPASAIAMIFVISAVGLMAMFALMFRDGYLVVYRFFIPVSEAETLQLRRDYRKATCQQQVLQ